MSATLLVVEDDPTIRDIMIDGLADAGYRTTGVASPAEAVAELALGRYDAVLTDAFRVLGSAATGAQWEALASLRTAAGATPIVIVTAHEIGDYADFRERGFAGLLAKPFDLDELYREVQRVLALA